MNYPTNPHMLLKIRSAALTDAIREMPCTLRIASFTGFGCGGRDTVVPCHLPTFGKGQSTKVSDLHLAAGCCVCHDLLDMRNPAGIKIRELYPHAYYERLFLGHMETMSMWVMAGVIDVKGAEYV